MGEESENPVIRAIRFSKVRLFLFTCVGLLLPITLYFGIVYGLDGRCSDSVFLLAVSVPLAILDVWVWRRLLTDTPAVVLTEKFLLDRASLFGAGRVARGTISTVAVEKQGWWTMVVVRFEDPNRWRRSAMLPTGLLDERAPDIAAEIEAWAMGRQRAS